MEPIIYQMAILFIPFPTNTSTFGRFWSLLSFYLTYSLTSWQVLNPSAPDQLEIPFLTPTPPHNFLLMLPVKKYLQHKVISLFYTQLQNYTAVVEASSVEAFEVPYQVAF